jgi:hypothetical protein
MNFLIGGSCHQTYRLIALDMKRIFLLALAALLCAISLAGVIFTSAMLVDVLTHHGGPIGKAGCAGPLIFVVSMFFLNWSWSCFKIARRINRPGKVEGKRIENRSSED